MDWTQKRWVIPGSRLLVATRAGHLQSGSPPARWTFLCFPVFPCVDTVFALSRALPASPCVYPLISGQLDQGPMPGLVNKPEPVTADIGHVESKFFCARSEPTECIGAFKIFH